MSRYILLNLKNINNINYISFYVNAQKYYKTYLKHKNIERIPHFILFKNISINQKYQ